MVDAWPVLSRFCTSPRRIPSAAILSSGVLAYLVETMPQADFTIVGSHETAPSVRRHAAPDPNSGPAARGTAGMDHPVEPGARHAVGADRRHARIDHLQPAASSEAGRARARPTPGLHAVEAGGAGAAAGRRCPHPACSYPRRRRVAADALVRPDDRPILAIGPGADWIGKRWPAERYVKLVLGPAGTGRAAGGRAGDDRRQPGRSRVGPDHPLRPDPLASDRAAGPADTPSRRWPPCRMRPSMSARIRLWTQLAVASGVPTVGGLRSVGRDRASDPGRGCRCGARARSTSSASIDPQLNQAIQHMMDLPAERVLKAANRAAGGAGGQQHLIRHPRA